MTLEELKTEANKLGYSLIKKKPYIHIKPCPVCGKKRYNKTKELVSIENKELQEVVDVILQALLEMEERFNKKFDEIDEWFDKFETKSK